MLSKKWQIALFGFIALWVVGWVGFGVYSLLTMPSQPERATNEARCHQAAQNLGYTAFATRDETAGGCKIYLPDGEIWKVEHEETK